VNDQLGHIEVATNGTHKVTDTEPPKPIDEGPQFLNGQSVDERLAALLQTIRTWDWRVASVAEGPQPAEAAASTVQSPHTATASVEVREDPEPLTVEEPVTSEEPVTGELPLTVHEAFTPGAPPVQKNADTQPVVLEPTPPATVDPPAPEKLEDAPDDATSPSEAEAESQPGTGPAPPNRRWRSHPWAQFAVLGLAAVGAVVLIVGGIRLFTKNPGSGDATSTTVSQSAHNSAHHDNQATPLSLAAPITAAQLTRYELWASGLQKANVTATTGFIEAGSTPTPAQITAVVTPYYTAVHLYDFQLHFIQWPASMQTAIEVDHAQMNALMSFMQSIKYVSPTGMSAWLSQLHNRTSTVQTADNQIHQDVGLRSSHSFP
jgi:hypothetical protein